jgi:Iron-sulfur cluster-binding domain/Radical SAM superfamily
MTKWKPDPPNSLQVEFVEGCNLFCGFCGLQGIRPGPGKGYKFMSLVTATRIAEGVRAAGWDPRIEFAMHGEPTLHPDRVSLVAQFRAILPKAQLMMTSNGGGLLGGSGVVGNLAALFDAGLNVYAFDAYEDTKLKDKVMDQLEAARGAGLPFALRYYPEDRAASVHQRWPRGTRVFVRLQDISVARAGNHAKLSNHCGAAFPPNATPTEKRCARPFREITVRHDGKVALCCNDWRGVYKVGDVNETPLLELWEGEAFDAARKFLIAGDRGAVDPCRVCDERSYRVGLLPDRMGQQTMPAPGAEERAVVAAAAAGDPYTAPVARPWERGGTPDPSGEKPVPVAPVEGHGSA